MCKRKTALRLSIPALLIPLTSLADPSQEAVQLRDSDRVVFFGDTLVEDQLFSRYVEAFIRVRYPQLKTRFINSGISGQTTADGLRRLQRDLEPLKPTLVVVCFGLHDPDLQPLDTTRIAAFRQSYAGILDAISALGARMVLVTPPCPAAQRIRQLGVENYDKIVERYASEILDMASSRGIPALDWFGLSKALGNETITPPGSGIRRQHFNLRPPKLAHAVLAAKLLRLWQAEPIEVHINADFASGTASTSSGSVRVRNSSDTAMTLSLEDIPLPWPMRELRTREELTGWPGAELCRFILHMENVPPTGLHLIWRSKRISFDAAELAGGLNINYLEPLRLSRPYRELDGQIDKKHRWHRHRIVPKRPEAPELQEAFDTYIRAMKLYEQGTTEIILRLPKTFDVLLQFRVNEEPDATPASTKPQTNRVPE